MLVAPIFSQVYTFFGEMKNGMFYGVEKLPAVILFI